MTKLDYPPLLQLYLTVYNRHWINISCKWNVIRLLVPLRLPIAPEIKTVSTICNYCSRVLQTFVHQLKMLCLLPLQLSSMPLMIMRGVASGIFASATLSFNHSATCPVQEGSSIYHSGSRSCLAGRLDMFASICN